MILRIPKMWTFKHEKKELPRCDAIFQATNITMDDNGEVVCPNCGEKFKVKDMYESYIAYCKSVNALAKDGLRSYPPESQIEAFENHIDGMKRKADSDRKEENS